MMPFPFFRDDELVCYCFQYTRRHIENDWLSHGRSLILDRIVAAKKTGGCDCAQKNPAGR